MVSSLLLPPTFMLTCACTLNCMCLFVILFRYMPITDSRMFYDDIPHGLCVLFGIAEILHVPTPMISKMIIENQIMMGKEYLVQTPDAKGKLLE